MTRLKPPVELCCFDFDGLLVDTARHWSRAYELTCKRHGYGLDDVDLTALQGASVPAAAAELSRHLGVRVDPAALLRDLTAMVEADAPTVLPGVRDLLDKLSGSVPLAVVSNSPEQLLAPALERLGLATYFDAVTSADAVPMAKPAPDVYLAACRWARVKPRRAVAFEDSPMGVASARAAGLYVVGVPSAAGELAADLVVNRIDQPDVLALLTV